MYPEWSPLLGGQSVPEGSHNCRLEITICACFIEKKNSKFSLLLAIYFGLDSLTFTCFRLRLFRSRHHC